VLYRLLSVSLTYPHYALANRNLGGEGVLEGLVGGWRNISISLIDLPSFLLSGGLQSNRGKLHYQSDRRGNTVQVY